jgi:hypothetical protein
MPANAALIATLTVDRPLCLACIAVRSQLSVAEVHSYLDRRLTPAVAIGRATEHCRLCGKVTEVFWMNRAT